MFKTEEGYEEKTHELLKEINRLKRENQNLKLELETNRRTKGFTYGDK